jgi:hypothetical protein
VSSDTDDGRALVQDQRDAFERRDWHATLEVYEQMRGMFKGRRDLRVEATCLAARALVALNDRPAARALLKPIAASDYGKATYYDFLAHAFLELRNYREVARLCERAADLTES